MDTIAIVLSVLVGAAGCEPAWSIPASRNICICMLHKFRPIYTTPLACVFVADVVQAYSARRAEQAQEQQAQEHHVAEQARQREQ